MSSPGSVTTWLAEFKAGNQQAAQHLWKWYFQQMVQLARRKLRNSPRRVADEEDVALSAFYKLCRSVQDDRSSQLHDRNDLWRLLVRITAQKALDRIRYEHAQKRPPAQVGEPDLEQIVGQEPTPEFVAQMADELQWLLDNLGDDELRSMVLWKMEGYTNEEIAAKLGRSGRTVERRLRLIRNLLEKGSKS
jgi:RNA polymerase sigma factor (sigma-70 family)